MRMPFHVTCVCDGPVPRNDTVERGRAAVLLDENRCVERQRVGHREGDVLLEDRRVGFVSSTPMLFIGRRPQTGTSRMSDGAFPAPLPPGVLRGFRRVGRRRLALRPPAPETAASKETRRLFFMLSGYFQQNAPGATPT